MQLTRNFLLLHTTHCFGEGKKSHFVEFGENSLLVSIIIFIFDQNLYSIA